MHTRYGCIFQHVVPPDPCVTTKSCVYVGVSFLCVSGDPRGGHSSAVVSEVDTFVSIAQSNIDVIILDQA